MAPPGPPTTAPPRSLTDRARDIFAQRRDAAAANPRNARISSTTGKKTTAQELADQRRMAERVAHALGSSAETVAAWYMGEDEPSPVINPRQMGDLQATVKEILEDSTFFKLVAPYLLWVVLALITVPIAADLYRRKRKKAKDHATKDHWTAAPPPPVPPPAPPVTNGAAAWFAEHENELR